MAVVLYGLGPAQLHGRLVLGCYRQQVPADQTLGSATVLSPRTMLSVFDNRYNRHSQVGQFTSAQSLAWPLSQTFNNSIDTQALQNITQRHLIWLEPYVGSNHVCYKVQVGPASSDMLFFDSIRYRYDMRVFLSIRYDTIRYDILSLRSPWWWPALCAETMKM